MSYPVDFGYHYYIPAGQPPKKAPPPEPAPTDQFMANMPLDVLAKALVLLLYHRDHFAVGRFDLKRLTALIEHILGRLPPLQSPLTELDQMRLQLTSGLSQAQDGYTEAFPDFSLHFQNNPDPIPDDPAVPHLSFRIIVMAWPAEK